MSQNTGCKGNITIPKGEFSKLSRSILEEYNKLNTQDVELFNREVIDEILEEQKGKRNVNWRNELFNKIYQKFPQNSYNTVYYFKTFDPNIKAQEVAYSAEKDKSKIKRIKPLKVKMTTEAQYVSLPFGCEAEFCFDKAKAQINLFVAYNNHNLEEAVGNPFYKSTIQKLKAIKYTKNTGGTIIATQESDYDCSGEHDTSYILMEFNSPATKKKNTLK